MAAERRRKTGRARQPGSRPKQGDPGSADVAGTEQGVNSISPVGKAEGGVAEGNLKELSPGEGVPDQDAEPDS